MNQAQEDQKLPDPHTLPDFVRYKVLDVDMSSYGEDQDGDTVINLTLLGMAGPLENPRVCEGHFHFQAKVLDMEPDAERGGHRITCTIQGHLFQGAILAASDQDLSAPPGYYCLVMCS